MVSPETVELLADTRRWVVMAAMIVAALAVVFAIVSCHRACRLKRALDREHTMRRTQHIRAAADYDRLRAHCIENGVDPDAREEDWIHG